MIDSSAVNLISESTNYVERIVTFILSGGLITAIGGFIALRNNYKKQLNELKGSEVNIEKDESEIRTNEWKNILEKQNNFEEKQSERNEKIIKGLEQSNQELREKIDKLTTDLSKNTHLLWEMLTYVSSLELYYESLTNMLKSRYSDLDDVVKNMPPKPPRPITNF